MMTSRDFGRALGAMRSLLAPVVILLALAMTCLPAAAQDFRVSGVRVEGNERIEPETILAYARIARGQALSAADLNAAYQRIQNSGLFESVSVEPQGGTLVIAVREFPTVNVINFEGNSRIKDEQLAAMIQTAPRKVYNPALVEADAQRLTEAYSLEGRFAATVVPKVIRRPGNRVDIAFEITEGKVTEIERVSITGNRAFSDRRLRQVLESKQAGLFRTFVRADTFNPLRIEADKQVLADFYRSRGYPDVQVTGVASELTRERDGFYMTFNVREGQKFAFGQVSTVSEIPELDAAEFNDLAKIRTGQTFSPNAIDLAITRMEQLALKKGVQFVRVDPRVTRNERDQTLDVEFALVRGPRVFVERIDIEGNTTTLDRVVRREFRAVEGDPFNPREIRNSAERIRALGFFANADVNSRQGSAPDQVLIDVNVEEQPTGSLGFGASYGKSQGVGFSASLEESNFLGRGQYLGISLGTTSDNNSSSLRFIEPYFLGRDLQFKFSAYYTTSENDNSFYNTRRIGISPAIEFPVSENGRLELRYTLSKDKLYSVEPYVAGPPATGSSPVLTYEQDNLGDRISSSLGYTYTWDTRRNQIDPRTRLRFEFSQDFAGLGGDIEGVTTRARFTAERKVFNEEVTLRSELEGGIIEMSGGTTVLQRFANGSKIRGFESMGIGPRDVDAPNQDALGGKYYVAWRNEAEFPIGLPEEYGITGGVFFDMGSVWGLDTDAAGLPVGLQGSDDFSLRSSVGVSIFWRSAIGPLRLNFSKALKKEDYDKTQNFDLTIETKF